MDDLTKGSADAVRSVPRKRPRDWALEPEVFGKTEFPVWLKARTDDEGVQLRTAQLQNLYAVRIRRGARSKRLTLAAYARKGRVGYGRLTKVLRGEVPMRLDDIAFGDLLVGAVSELSRRDAGQDDR